MQPPARLLLIHALALGLSPIAMAQPASQGFAPARGDTLQPASGQAAGLPRSQAEWLRQAQALEKRGDWPGLLVWGRQWTQSESSNALAWFVLGRAFNELKRYPEAIAAYQENLRIEPDDVYAQNNLGNVYRDSQRYRDAMQAYRAAVRIDPDYVQAWHNIGLMYYDLTGQAGVMDAFRQVRRVNPELATAWYQLMIGYYQSGDEAAAREAVRVLRRLQPDDADRLLNILISRLPPPPSPQTP